MRAPATLLLATLMSTSCLGAPMKLPELHQQTQIATYDGKRVRVHGTVVRPEMKMGPGNTWNGTGLELDDGTLLWVSYAKEAPDGWVDGQRVAVDALVWRGAPPEQKSAVTGPHLSDWSTPVVREEPAPQP